MNTPESIQARQAIEWNPPEVTPLPVYHGAFLHPSLLLSFEICPPVLLNHRHTSKFCCVLNACGRRLACISSLLRHPRSSQVWTFALSLFTALCLAPTTAMRTLTAMTPVSSLLHSVTFAFSLLLCTHSTATPTSRGCPAWRCFDSLVFATIDCNSKSIDLLAAPVTSQPLARCQCRPWCRLGS